MDCLKNKTLFNYIRDYPRSDSDAISFINSDKCTIQMVNYTDEKGVTPLIITAEKSRYKVVEALLSKGANVYTASSINSKNALLSAISDISDDGSEEQENQLRTLSLLTQGIKNLDYLNEGFTFACEINQTQVIKKLLNDFNYADEILYKGIKYLLIHENEEAIHAINSVLLYRNLQAELKSSLMPNKKIKV